MRNCASTPWVFFKPDGASSQSVATAFRNALESAGIPDFRFDDLRRAGGSRAFDDQDDRALCAFRARGGSAGAGGD
jgi:hypothetical protein